MIEELKHIKYVYHYTSLETLLVILENYRNNRESEGLIFRASNIYKMNDPKEMDRGYDIVKNFLQNYEIDNIPKHYWLHEIANNKDVEKECKKEYIVGDKNFTIEPKIIPFAVSFSAKRDYLPMWSLYGNKGRGVCLKFDVYDMIICSKQDEPRQIGFVSYDKTSGFTDIRKIIIDAYGWYMDKYKNKPNQITKEIKIGEMAELCFYISPFLKYKDYKYEKEFRLAYYQHYGVDINTDHFKNGFIGPETHQLDNFIPVIIPVSAFKEIILGPGMNNDTKNALSHVIKDEFNGCNLRVKISKSKIPFRLS